jgi:hypothetical protein
LGCQIGIRIIVKKPGADPQQSPGHIKIKIKELLRLKRAVDAKNGGVEAQKKTNGAVEGVYGYTIGRRLASL